MTLAIIGMIGLILLGIWIFVIGFVLASVGLSQIGDRGTCALAAIVLSISLGTFYLAWHLSPFEIVVSQRSKL